MDNIRVCTRCIMDTTVPDIVFDEKGVCNYCMKYEERIKNELFDSEMGQKSLEALIADIKQRGVGREYDCIIGVSGGVDSTYVAYLVKKQFGLRPLAVHLDNGWDSELAVSNIEQVLRRLDIDLYTHVLDWEEFKSLQVAFLKSSIANAEIPTDQAIMAVLFQKAAALNVKYVLTGYNLATEAILPASWMSDHKDVRLIRSIHRQFGQGKLRTYPLLTMWGFVNCIFFKGIKFTPILNFVSYNKEEAKRLLQEELGWRDYGGKHYESIYTRFFQSYLLPRKFNIDKRKAHLSNLVLSSQITREDALEEMKKPPYPLEQQEEDGEYVLKKLGLSNDEFSEILSTPPKSFMDYPNDVFWWRTFDIIARIARRKALSVG